MFYYYGMCVDYFGDKPMVYFTTRPTQLFNFYISTYCQSLMIVRYEIEFRI